MNRIPYFILRSAFSIFRVKTCIYSFGTVYRTRYLGDVHTDRGRVRVKGALQQLSNRHM